jgi:hypothetical protein
MTLSASDPWRLSTDTRSFELSCRQAGDGCYCSIAYAGSDDGELMVARRPRMLRDIPDGEFPDSSGAAVPPSVC